MSLDFTKVTYVDGETVIGADNLNDIQDAILDLDENKVEKEQGKGLSANDFTDTDKQKVDDAYVVPEGGIPKSALADAVQTSLGKADTALQEDDLEDLTNDVDNLKSAKAPAIFDTASGTIASFEDGADGMPLKALTVNVEPVQDLHGYDNPWPAGGGKNLFPMTVDGIKAVNTSGSWSGNTWTRYGVSFAIQTDEANNVTGVLVSGTATSTVSLILATENPNLTAGTGYILSGCPSGGSNSTYGLWSDVDGTVTNYGQSDTSYTWDGAKQQVGKIRIASGYSIQSGGLLFRPLLRLATVTDNTFAPYANICPISGWTGCNVARTGKNLFGDLAIGKRVTANGDIVDSDNSYWISRTKFSLEGNRNLTTTVFDAAGYAGSIGYAAYTADGTFVGTGLLIPAQYTDLPVSNTTNFPDSVSYVRFRGYQSGGAGSVLESKVQVEFGSVSSDYEPFGTDYSIAFPTSAGTVYGGTLTINADGSGELSVDRAFLALDTAQWAIGGTSGTERFYTGAIISTALYPETVRTVPELICSKYRTVRSFNYTSFDDVITLTTAGSLVIRDTSYSDVPSFLDSLADATLVYRLANPVVYQLTASQITTLLGANSIWADCGPVSVDYPADTKLYIQKINAPTDDDMTADTQIASGKYFLIGNTLYLSTTVIPAGDTIIPGTNCQKTNLAAALNALNV